MRNACELLNMDNLVYLASAPKGEIIKSIASLEGRLYVCTEKHIYILIDDKRLEAVDDAP